MNCVPWRVCVLKSDFDEMNEIVQYLGSSKEEDSNHENILEEIESAVGKKYPELKLHRFGSKVANLDTFRSDLDVIFAIDRLEMNKEMESESEAGFVLNIVAKVDTAVKYSKSVKIGWINKIAKVLGKISNYRVRTIKKATIPIITVHVKSTNTDVDVGVDLTSYNTVPQLYNEKYPYFRPICIILKELLYQHNVHKPFHGGLGSYKLYILVAIHLKTICGKCTLFEALLSCLKHYGQMRVLHKNATFRIPLESIHMELTSSFQLPKIVDIFQSAHAKLKLNAQNIKLPISNLHDSWFANVLNPKVLYKDRTISLLKHKRRTDV